MSRSSVTFAINADTSRYQREIQGAENRTRRYGQTAQQTGRLNDQLAGTFTRAANSVNIMSGPLNGVSGRLSAVASGMRNVGVQGVLLGSGLAIVTTAVTKGVREFAELEKRLARTDAILKATNFSAGFSAGDLDEMARTTALGTLASVNGIREAQDILLTFRNVSGSVFRDTIALSQDLAVVMGGSASSAAKQLGKVLEDPVNNLSALTRSGVSFSKAQQDIIKDLAESGRLFEAQAIVIEQVRKQVGGAGSAEAGGLSGQVDTLSQRMSELFQVIGSGASEWGVFQTGLKGATAFTEQAIMAIDPEKLEFAKRQEYFDDLVRQREEAMDRMRAAGDPDKLRWGLNPFRYDRNNFSADQETVDRINEELKAMQERQMQRQKESSEAQRLSEEYQKQEQAAAELARQEEAAAKAAERRAKAVEDANRALTRTSQYWKDIFGDPKSDKPVQRNQFFDSYARLTNDSIERGSAAGAEQNLSRLKNTYELAKGNPYVNYDLDGMRSVIERLENMATVRWNDLGQAANDQRRGWNGSDTVVQFEGAGQSINLLGEAAEALNQQFRLQKETMEEQRRQSQQGGDVTRRVDVRVEIVEGRRSFSDGSFNQAKDAVERSINDVARAVAN